MGSNYNGRRLLAKCNTPYFMWIGGHDYVSKNYVAPLKEILDKDLDTVLASGAFEGYYKESKQYRDRPLVKMEIMAGDNIFKRLSYVISGICTGSFEHMIVYGLRRTEVLKNAHKSFLPSMGSDLVFIMREAMNGKFKIFNSVKYYYEIDDVVTYEHSFARASGRYHNEDSLNSHKSRLAKAMFIELLRSPNINKYLHWPILIKNRIHLHKNMNSFRLKKWDIGEMIADSYIGIKFFFTSYWRILLLYGVGCNYLLSNRLFKLLEINIHEIKGGIAIFGAGLHTRRIIDLNILPIKNIKVIYDDNPQVDNISGIPVKHSSEALQGRYGAIIASSDRYRRRIVARTMKCACPGATVIALYSWKILRKKT